jgi:Asp-tRNA(Asn)/Glu-tRNA(Gln) amidotransferase A subunit family amidase
MLPETATGIASAVGSGELKATDVVQASLARIETLNPLLNAFTDVTAERALTEAEGVDAAVAGGADLPLAGVPFAVKNLFDIEGVVTRAGSKINRENPPATADATLVSNLRKAGGILMGGLHMGEYAYDFTGENVHDGNCLNPHDPGRMSGGSSSGSGSAAASGMVPVTLGSDTNGSIRVPSSFCGLFGLKPTYGRLSRHGTYPFVGSLDHLGPLARSARDLALVFDVLQGRDPAILPRRTGPSLQRAGNWRRTQRVSGSPSPGAISGRRPNRKPLPPSTRSPTRWAPRPKSTFPRRRGRAPPPM